MPLQTKTPPTITAAAAALFVTDGRRHLPPCTPAPPRKPLSCASAQARVRYRGHLYGEGANVEYRRRRQPGLQPRLPHNINMLRVKLVSIVY